MVRTFIYWTGLRGERKIVVVIKSVRGKMVMKWNKMRLGRGGS
jgi:hypothetical protein